METGGCGALTVVWDTSHGGGGGQVGIRTRQSCFQPKNHVYEFIRFVWWLKSKRVWCTSCCQIHREGDVAQMRKQQRSMMKCVMKSYFSPQGNFPGFDLNSGISHNVAASCFLQNWLAAFFFFFFPVDSVRCFDCRPWQEEDIFNTLQEAEKKWRAAKRIWFWTPHCAVNNCCTMASTGFLIEDPRFAGTSRLCWAVCVR